MATEILRPNGDNTAALSRNTGSSNYQQVDESSADNDSTYVYTNSTSHVQDRYNLDDSALTTELINSVKVTARSRATTSGSEQIYGVRLGGSSSTDTQGVASSGSYTSYQTGSLSRPGGGSWSGSDLDSILGVLSLKCGSGSFEVRCTQFFITVDYSPNQTTSPSGIASEEAFGTPAVNLTITGISGIASAEAFGAVVTAIGSEAPPLIFEIDWDGDGFFGNAYSDVTADTLALDCKRGRDRASQVVGRSTAGTLRATLKNLDGQYSSFNTSSGLYGKVLPLRKVRVLMSSVSIWTGYLSRVSPSVSGQLNTVEIEASGSSVKLSGPTSKVNPPAQAGVYTGAIVDAILDEVGWPAANRSIDAGVVLVNNWYVQDRNALQAIQEITDDTEFGFFREGVDWDVIFEQRDYRSTYKTSSQATFSDAPGASLPYETIKQADPLEEIFNEITATVQPYSVQSPAVLWTLADVPFALAAGASITYVAQYPNASADANAAYVSAWTTPEVGTDIAQTGVSDSDIGVSVTKTATKMFITITNNHGSDPASITLLQARGTPVLKSDSFQVSASDATSQSKYGVRSYPLPSPWFPSASVAQTGCDYIVAQDKDPRPILTIGFSASKSAALKAQALNRDISDRITIEAENNVKLGINQDFYIESIHHMVQPGTYHFTEWSLSPA